MADSRRDAFLKSSGVISEQESPVEPIVEQQEEPQQEVIEQKEPEVEESFQEESEYFTPFYSDDEPVQEEQTNVQNHPEVKLSQKVKYNLKDYADTHAETLSEYYKFKNLDVDSLGNEQLLRIKLEQENPSWNAKDIDEELKDVYGIGVTLKALPEDPMDDEVREYEKMKALIEKGERRMKSDVAKARQTLKERKETLQLPEVELDIEVLQDPTKVIEKYTEEQINQANKYREETWIPSISEAISKVSGFRQQFDVESNKGDKVVEELTYKLTDAQKAKLKEHLSDYVPHPSDAIYQDADTGSIDYSRFVSDKAKMLFVDDIIKASVKEATAKLRQKFVKEDMVNFSEEPRRVSKGDNEPKDARIAHFEKRAANRQMRQGSFR